MTTAGRGSLRLMSSMLLVETSAAEEGVCERGGENEGRAWEAEELEAEEPDEAEECTGAVQRWMNRLFR